MMTAEERQKLIDKASSAAAEIQSRDDVCSRSTLAGLAEVFDFIPEEFVTASASLCGGTGSASGSCGAYCAGLLALGLRYNGSIAEEQANPDKNIFGETTAVWMSRYRDRFLAEHGTILCPKIQEKLFGRSFDLADPDDVQAFFEVEGHAEACGTIVASAARIAAELLLEAEPEE